MKCFGNSDNFFYRFQDFFAVKNFWITPGPQKSTHQLKRYFYVLGNNFWYTQFFFFFFFRKIHQKESYYIHNDTDDFFLFPLQKDFDICLELFFAFSFFFFKKILISFMCFFLKLFFVFLIIFIYHFYVYTKTIYK